jgi:EAL domain-containing protein (putative c-di-GMP-specific phosphodiesterase class I)
MSAGVAVYPDDGGTVQALMRNADSALYDAKGRGRGCFQVYRPELTDSANSRLMLDADLRNAINNEEFEIYYQPLIDIHSGAVSSVEALLRWHHPKKGLLGPEDFIDYALESGLICLMGDWVIQRACEQLARWRDGGIRLAMSINVSARQFQQDSLIARVARCLQQFNLDPQLLIIEITEQIFMEEVEAVLQRVQALRDLGVKISLDDFGTGYSSLNYIVRFSPDYLKIDRSFVARIGEQAQHNDMVEAIVGLGRIVPLGIVAEGVETQEQFDFLKTCGCNFAQGFYFSKPCCASDLSAYLTHQEHRLAAECH